MILKKCFAALVCAGLLFNQSAGAVNNYTTMPSRQGYPAPVAVNLLSTPHAIIYYYAMRGDVAALNEAKKRFSIDSLDAQKNTPLCEAIWRGDRQAANVLVSAGADMQARCLNKIPPEYTAAVGLAGVGGLYANTPTATFDKIYFHAAREDTDVLQQIVDAGDSLDVLDAQGNTPLCKAIYQNNCVAYDTLKKAGADTDHPCVSRVPPKFQHSFQCGSNNTLLIAALVGAAIIGGVIIIAAASGGGGGSSSGSGGGGGGGGGELPPPDKGADYVVTAGVSADDYTINPAANTEGANEQYRDIYGMKGDETQKLVNAYPDSISRSITLTNNSDGNMYGMYSANTTDRMYNALLDEHTNFTGTIKLTNDGNGNVYGMHGASITNAWHSWSACTAHSVTGIIDITNFGNGNTYGLYGNNIINATATSASHSAIGRVLINSFGTGKAYGIYGTADGAIQNNSGSNYTSTIEMRNIGAGRATGMYSDGGTLSNSGTIGINNLSTGTVVGIYADTGTTVTNSGPITITRTNVTIDGTLYEPATPTGGTAYGIYAKSGATVTNSGTISLSGAETSYGIYAESGATISNTGTISLDGVTCSGTCDGSATNGNHIVLEGGAILMTAGLMWSPDFLDFDGMGGSIIAQEGAQFVAEDGISGTLYLSDGFVKRGFGTQYTAADLINTSNAEGLNLVSRSALFNSALAENGTDVALTMKEFNSVVPNASLAQFLSNNYLAQNNELFFSALKSFDSVSALNQGLSNFGGMPSFSRLRAQDTLMTRALNQELSARMFAADSDRVSVAGTLRPMGFGFSQDSAASYSLTHRKLSTGFGIGVGMSMATIRDASDSSYARKDNVYQFYMPMTYDAHGFKLLSMPRLGYARGTYSRPGWDTTYHGTLEKRIYGLTNEIRYPIDLGFMVIEPAVEMNALMGTQAGRERKKAFSLTMPSMTYASLETGIGLYAKRDYALGKDKRLALSGGLAAYREFADPRALKIGMTGMQGTFELADDAYAEYRGVMSFNIGYDWRDVSWYASAYHFMAGQNQTDIKTGLKVAI